MGKIVNGVANDFEFDINDYNMFPPNVEKVIITKENYNRLFKGLEEENMFLRDVIEAKQNKIDKATEYIWSTKYEYGDLEEDNEDFDIDVYKLLKILEGSDNNE